MHDVADTFAEVARLVSAQTGYPVSQITFETTLFGDLGVDGDDASLLLEASHSSFTSIYRISRSAGTSVAKASGHIRFRYSCGAPFVRYEEMSHTTSAALRHCTWRTSFVLLRPGGGSLPHQRPNQSMKLTAGSSAINF